MGKIVEIDKLVSILEYYKLNDNKIGLCCGGFDLLHPGHIMHFESAKKLCDVLTVAVTCDKFVGKRKGTGRPVFNENLRIYSVSQLVSVDFAFVCPYNTAIEVIQLLKPNYYIKGPDYINNNDLDLLLEKQTIQNLGGEIKFTEDTKFSSTEIIKYIKEKL